MSAANIADLKEMPWDKLRRPTGTIDLVEAAKFVILTSPHMPDQDDMVDIVSDAMQAIERIQLIRSRQVAAVAISSAILDAAITLGADELIADQDTRLTLLETTNE